MPWNNVENRADRASLARDAGLGQVSLISVLAGTLVAYGAFAVVLAITAAVAKAAGVDADLSGNDWQRLGTAGGVVVAGVLLVSYLMGGYVAGRMARRAGSLNGFLVFVLGVLVAVAVTAIVNVFTDGEDILNNLRNVGVPTSSDEWGDIGTVAGIGSVLAMILGSVLGGILGERWHGKLVTRALDPDVGPEAQGRTDAAAAAERRLERQRRTAATTRAGRRDDVDERDRGRDDVDEIDDRPVRPWTAVARRGRGRDEDRVVEPAADDAEPTPAAAEPEPAGVEPAPATVSDEEAARESEREARARARDERARMAAAARSRGTTGTSPPRRRR